MKKLLTLALTAAMLLQGAVSVFADDAAGLALAEGSHLKVENGIVDMIDGTLTVGELKAEFAGAVDVAGKADDALVFADDVVSAGGESAKAIIWGDASKDGKITLTDATRMLQSIAKWSVDLSETAADVDRSGKVNLSDVSKLMQKLAKWDDISLGNVRMVFENKKLTAEHEDSSLKLSFTSIMNKVGAHQLESTDEYSYKIKTARNEYESCTVLLYSETEREGMTAELSPFVSEFGDAVLPAELQWVQYLPDYPMFIEIDADNFSMQRVNETAYADDLPEVILSMADTFELEEKALRQFVITTAAEKDTPAGMYKATLTFKDADGKEVKKADVYAYVWDFTVPDAPYSASLFAGWDGRPEVYDFLLDHNLSSYNLPYDITDPRADAYMSDPRVTAFVIAGGGQWYGESMYGGSMDRSDEETVANYKKVMSDPEWAKKGLFYYTDEPWGNRLDYVKMTYERVTELLGTTNIRNITPLAGNDGYGSDYCQKNEVDPVAYIDPYINVWCPQSPAFHLINEGGKWTLRRWYNKFGEFADRAKTFKEKGEEMWWYVCCSPEVPYANYFTFYQGVIVRLLSWQQYFNDVDGVLYYRTFGGNISKYQFNIGNGDGILAFEGRYWGRTGEYGASWRLLQIRDGFDDFDYLRMAEELVGREGVMKVVNKVTQGMLKYTEDYNVLEAARDEIVQLILDNQK